jgi:acyl-CoA synthetase (AMP-forming)/AMP-acid ligase II
MNMFDQSLKNDYWTEIRPHLQCDVPEAGTLCAILAHRARHQENTLFCTVADGRSERSLTFGELYAGARRYAGALRGAGLEPGDTVALMLPTGRAFLFAYFGAQLAGLVPAATAPPFMPRQMEVFVWERAELLNGIDAAGLIASRDRWRLALAVQKEVPTMRQVLFSEDLNESGALPSGDPDVSPAGLAMIQFSSGSNGRQRGVGLTHGNLVSNIRAVHLAMATTREDVIVVWLPLYHDMGLLGCVCQGLFAGCRLVLIPPNRFIGAPTIWLRIMHEKSGTIGVAPNFGYQLCVDRGEGLDPGRIDLSAWRMALNGSEMVAEETVTRFVERFGPFGFRREAFMPVYGLAEATVAVCFMPPGAGARVDRIDLGRLAETGVARPAAPGACSGGFVSVGRPVPGVAVKLVDPRGRPVDERVQGRLLVRAPSVMAGYYNDPDATDAVLRDGWLDTGDLAYAADGFYYITGRSKDVIIRAGRNYIPEHFERAAAAVPGIRKNAVAAFGVPAAGKGTEEIVIIAETKVREPEARRELEQAVVRSISRRLEVTPDVVVLLPPRSIPKTTSGKVKRPVCRQSYIDEKRRIDSHEPSPAP